METLNIIICIDEKKFISFLKDYNYLKRKTPTFLMEYFKNKFWQKYLISNNTYSKTITKPKLYVICTLKYIINGLFYDSYNIIL